MVTRLPLVLCALGVAACAHTAVPDRDRLHVELGYANAPRQLATSVHVAPFFRDASRRLLSREAPDELALMVTPKGAPILPGRALEVLPAGTRVRVLSVGFPTAWESVARPLMTPRDRVWVELAVDGRPGGPAYVFVLPPSLDSAESVREAIDGLLTREDLAPTLAALSAAERELVRTKILACGVSSKALLLAFGKPYLQRVYGDGVGVAEEWVWQTDTTRRTAFLRDGVVLRLELPPAPAAAHASR
jgi:hypothetical protein